MNYLDEDEQRPPVRTRNDLRSVADLSTVHVLSESHRGIAYVGLERGCSWDDEHGAGVLLHLARVVDMGGSTSFMAARRRPMPRAKGSPPNARLA